MNDVKTFKGQSYRFALWELVPNQQKSFPPDQYDLAGMNDSTMMSDKTSTA